MDARPLAGIVRLRLKALGVRTIPSGPRAATRASPAGLTPREAEVLALVRRGLTDREIAERLVLSPRTVGHHVSALLGKLGARRRTDVIVSPDPEAEDG